MSDKKAGDDIKEVLDYMCTVGGKVFSYEGFVEEEKEDHFNVFDLRDQQVIELPKALTVVKHPNPKLFAKKNKEGKWVLVENQKIPEKIREVYSDG